MLPEWRATRDLHAANAGVAGVDGVGGGDATKGALAAAALIQHVTDRATLEDLATSSEWGRGDVILVSIGQFMGMS